jgi:IS30 family transposase
MGQEKDIRKRSKWKQLSEKERYQLEALLRLKHSPAAIAKHLGRDRRTIEREIARGSVIQRDSDWREQERYCADAGQRVKEENASKKGRTLKIGKDHALAQYLEEKIGKEKYSPDAAIGEARMKGLQFTVTLCTKTVYNYLEKELFLNISNKDLPCKRNGKKRAYRHVRKVALNNTKGRSIEERPPKIKSREEYGHWEMDCVVGCTRACLLVLTERRSREEKIIKLHAKTQAQVKAAIDGLERKYKGRFREIFKSITMDNGPEFLDAAALENSVLKPGEKRTTCYYAHPYSAWERGSNENANKLIRRFIPKGKDIGKITKRDVQRIENWMNNYPRRMFGYNAANDIKFAAQGDW